MLVIQKAGNHMEHTILGSIASLLVGFLITSHGNNEIEVRRHLRNGEFSEMVGTLEKYYEFMNLTVSVSIMSYYNWNQINNYSIYSRKPRPLLNWKLSKMSLIISESVMHSNSIRYSNKNIHNLISVILTKGIVQICTVL